MGTVIHQIFLMNEEKDMNKIIFTICCLCCFLNFSAHNVYALDNMMYYKYNNVVMVHVESNEFSEAVLFVAQYSGDNLVKVDKYNIELTNGKYESSKIKISDGIDYKFFLWKDIEQNIPLYKPLIINTSTPNGSNDNSDGEYTNPY